MLYGIIPFQTISVNKMYKSLILIKKGFAGKAVALDPKGIYKYITVIRALSGEAKQQKKDIINYIEGEIELNTPLRIEIEIYGSWFNKDGSVKKKDLDEKLLIDAIFEALPTIDDSMIFEKTVKKVQSDKPQVVFVVSKLDKVEGV